MRALPIIALLLAASTFAKAQTWNAASDFKTSANPNGQWQYGSFTLEPVIFRDLPPDALTFQPLQNSYAGPTEIRWTMDPTVSDLGIYRLLPSQDNRLFVTAGYSPSIAYYSPVIRWVAPHDGTFNVSANFTYSGRGAQIANFSQVGIRTGTTLLATNYIGGPESSLLFDEQVLLQSGQALDFFIARDLHSISLEVVVASVPESSTTALFILGGMLLSRKCRLTPRSTRAPTAARASPA